MIFFLHLHKTSYPRFCVSFIICVHYLNLVQLYNPSPRLNNRVHVQKSLCPFPDGGDNDNIYIRNDTFIARTPNIADCLSLDINVCTMISTATSSVSVSRSLVSLFFCAPTFFTPVFLSQAWRGKPCSDFLTQICKKLRQVSSRTCYSASFPNDLLLHVSIISCSFKQTCLWLRLCMHNLHGIRSACPGLHNQHMAIFCCLRRRKDPSVNSKFAIPLQEVHGLLYLLNAWLGQACFFYFFLVIDRAHSSRSQSSHIQWSKQIQKLDEVDVLYHCFSYNTASDRVCHLLGWCMAIQFALILVDSSYQSWNFVSPSQTHA